MPIDNERWIYDNAFIWECIEAYLMITIFFIIAPKIVISSFRHVQHFCFAGIFIDSIEHFLTLDSMNLNNIIHYLRLQSLNRIFPPRWIILTLRFEFILFFIKPWNFKHWCNKGNRLFKYWMKFIDIPSVNDKGMHLFVIALCMFF